MNNLIFLAVDCISDCGGADVLRILKFVFILIDLVFFIIPIGLIVMLMIDFGKNVIAGKEDEMKKNLNMVIKRIIYCVVLFLVPTIANFAISLVGTDGENAVSTAAACINYAREYTNEELAQCEIDYETFEPQNPKEPACYVCKDKEIYAWDTEIPADDYNGCTSGYLKSAITTKEMCEDEKKCWKCVDGSGYVFSNSRPTGGYPYSPGTSFNYTSSSCGAGFYDKSVDNSNCIDREEFVSGGGELCWQCKDSSGYVLSGQKPVAGVWYRNLNSFNYSGKTCEPGYDETVDSSCCTEEGCK